MSDLEVVAEIARRHGVDSAAIVAAPFQGAANFVYFLGEDLVLRIARPETVEDLRKESRVIPAAVRAGVRTPEIVDFDHSGRLMVPYMVLKRASGSMPELPAQLNDERRRVYRELGAELAVLHQGVGALPEVPVDHAGVPGTDVATLASAGHLSTDLADWLIGWFDRLETYLPSESSYRLIHGDASLQNLLIDPKSQRLNAILDWGDAAWADPATEFAKLPLRAVPAVLEGYTGGCDDAWAARVLWHHLHWAIGGLSAAPRPQATHWSAQPANRILEVLRFFLADPPHPWTELR